MKVTPKLMGKALADSLANQLNKLDKTVEKGKTQVPLTDDNKQKLSENFRDTFSLAQESRRKMDDAAWNKFQGFKNKVPFEGRADLEALAANRQRAVAKFQREVAAPVKRMAAEYGGVVEEGSRVKLDTDRFNDPSVALPTMYAVDPEKFTEAYKQKVTAALTQAFETALGGQPATTPEDLKKVIGALPKEYQNEAAALLKHWQETNSLPTAT